MIATNNGSFPWRDTPAGREVADLRRRRAAGAPCADDLRLAEDRVIRAAIEEQARAGCDLLTDGMVRWQDPLSCVVDRLRGLERGEERSGFPGGGGAYAVPIAAGEVAWREPILSEDFLFASQGSPRPVKAVLTGPFTIAKLAEDRAYGEPMALAMALAAALNQELRALQSVGAGVIQVNEPALLQHKGEFPLFTRIWEVLGRGISASLALYLEGGGLEGLYPGVARLKRLGCLSLDGVAGAASLGLLESDPLPEGLRLGLGMVDGRNPAVEDPEALSARVRRIGGLPPHDRILLGTAGDLGGLPVEVASAKLRALALASRALERA